MNGGGRLNKTTLAAALAVDPDQEFLLFWGHQKSPDGRLTKRCFSQWWESPFCLGDRLFRTAEHYMMVRKAELFDDQDAVSAILAAPTPKEAKALGRKIRGFSETVWLDHREEIVFMGNFEKFSQNESLQKFLLDTRNAILVEASPVDSIWGIGLAGDDQNARNPAAWPGLNLLGFTLMNVREALRQRTQRINETI